MASFPPTPGPTRARFGVFLFAVLTAVAAGSTAVPSKPKPDAQFDNWLYKTPNPATWRRSEADGRLTFAVDLPAGDFCTLTLFPGAVAGPDFARQFNEAVNADQQGNGTVKVDADGGNEPSKSQEGFDVLIRRMQSETANLHTYHFYLGGHSGDRFDLAAFQTSSQEMWQKYGAEAVAFLQSLKLANSLPPDQVAAMVGPPAAMPPALPGFDVGDNGRAAPAAAATARPTDAATPTAPPPPANIPVIGLDRSPIVRRGRDGSLAVLQRNGKPLDGVTLSVHDKDIFSPDIVVTADGTIHVAFIEQHASTFAYAVYYRASHDGGKTWSEAKNLSEVMPNWRVGNCAIAADGAGRVYVLWRTGVREGFSAQTDARAVAHNNLVYRVLENGKWNGRALPVHPPASAQNQDDGSLSWFVATDPRGHVHVIWNTTPGRFHPELMMGSGTYKQHLSGIGNSLVMEADLDGTAPEQPHELYLAKVNGSGWSRYSDDFEALEGYVDAAGAAHFIASVKDKRESAATTRLELIEDGQQKPAITLPDQPWNLWRNPAKLLVDAQGRRHIIARYGAGEHPGFRDYTIGSDDEPVVIRAPKGTKGTADYFEAFQGPGGHMIVAMQMNDTGEKGDAETYLSVSDGGAWSEAVNVTNNAGRKDFWSRQTSSQSALSTLTRFYPGPAAAAFDREGHLLVAMVNNEATIVDSRAFGVALAGGESTQPVLSFVRF